MRFCMWINFTRFNLSQYARHGFSPQSSCRIAFQGRRMTVRNLNLCPNALAWAWRRSVVWLVAAALGGCAVQSSTPLAGIDIPVPDRWSPAGAEPLPGESGTELAQWWQRFSDPMLTALVLQALQSNTDVRAARAALQQSRALRDGRAAGMGLGVNASASAQRSR